ncbi:hypothetical protein ACFYNW_36050 [Streptomyces virginiae]|uniref:hypothetical protein n=1 Tax=Streptomyces virginiae TaxID=1961 RepID=UPI0036EE617C
MIGLGGAYLVSSNNGAKATSPAAETPAASAPGAPAQGSDGALMNPSPSPPRETSASRPPASKPVGTVLWEGPLVISVGEPKDLDTAPPVHSRNSIENDVAVIPPGGHVLSPEIGLKGWMEWKDSAKAPSYADCSAVDTLGSKTQLKLKTGMVFCVRTKEGQLARLTVKELDGWASDARGTFDVVVWNR